MGTIDVYGNSLQADSQHKLVGLGWKYRVVLNNVQQNKNKFNLPFYEDYLHILSLCPILHWQIYHKKTQLIPASNVTEVLPQPKCP